VPVDGSNTANKAITYVAKLVGGDLGAVHLLIVLETGMYKGDSSHPCKGWAQSILEESLDTARKAGITDATTELAYGDVPETIVGVARSRNIDIIVMGTRGRTGSSIPMMGHVSEKVVEMAHCPVLLVR